MSGVASRQPFLWRGHPLELLAARALWDPEQQALLLADLHLGKAEVFQAHGVPLPSDGGAADLERLLRLAESLRPRQVLVLGDLIHGRLALTPQLRQRLRQLPEQLGCPLRLIGGNHERGSEIEGLRQEAAQSLGPLWLSHAPAPRPGSLNVCGHLHPVAWISGAADRLRLPCFAFRQRDDCLVLPAFGQLTGGEPCHQGEMLWLVANEAILPWTPAPAPPRHRRRSRAA
ncbi:MAG: ligase-associated DNA damage response endonuclease PdeM [Synechococcaceae cyanobacterium]|jgi:DNA ligase-associated metallophosphoesterase|nr:ligase-associated DNA damage response endonuclease PdeM [Synechococcaceae cyanobacterium]